MVGVDRRSTRYKAILQKTSSFQLLRGLSEPNASLLHDLLMRGKMKARIAYLEWISSNKCIIGDSK